MPMTEAQRKANRKYDSTHNTVMSFKIRKKKAEAFKAAAKAAGTTPNAVFSAAADAFMQEHGGWDTWMTATAGSEDIAGDD